METVTILEKSETLNWDYDEDADVLYLSAGDPQPAVGVDIGGGVVLRYDENQNRVVGVTVTGVRTRLMRALAPPKK
jgi:uncharacterized protein YuzE